MNIRFEIKRSMFRRQWYWTLFAANGRKIATSGETYHNRNDCLHGVRLVQRAAASAEVQIVGDRYTSGAR